MTVGMMKQLDSHVRSLAAWSGDLTNNARAVVLTGSQGTFCSGLDLHDNERKDDAQDEHGFDSLKDGANMVHHMTRVTNQLMSLPVLSVSAIDGYAVGGGAELTTCTDLVVLSRGAKVQFVHSKRGASPGWGGARRLVEKVGRRRALRMLLLGECVSGEDEASSGGTGNGTYADFVADEGETALDAAMRLAINPLLELPCSRSIRAIKTAVSFADGDGDVIDCADGGSLKLSTNLAMRGEMDAFLSVWGGKSNLEQIQKARSKSAKKNQEDVEQCTQRDSH